MVASSTATIYFIDQHNVQKSLSDHIDVPRRTVTWVPHVGGATGQPGQGGSPAEIMDLRTQIHGRWRNPGAPWTLAYAPAIFRNACNAASVYDSASVYQANAVCTGNLPNFSGAVSCLWSHESLHMPRGVDAAKSTTKDVYALREPLVRESLGDLTTSARALYSGAHTQVRNTLIGAHSPITEDSFHEWWLDIGAGWREHSYPLLCP